MRFKLKIFLFTQVLIFSFTAIRAGLLDKANEFYNQGKYLEAIPLYKKAALEGESPTLSYFNCANAYFQLDSLPQCIVFYKSATTNAPDFFRAHLNLSIAYYSMNEVGECIASITRALELEPNDPKAMTILAASYRKAGALPQAIVAFEKLLYAYPDKEDGYIALAEMYRDLSNDDQAIKWLLKYPETGQNDAYVFQMLSEIYESNNNFEKALYYTKETFNKEPDNKWVFFRICMFLQQMGNDLVALEEAQRGLDQFTDFPELALFAGNIAIKYSRLEEARRLYKIAYNSGHPDAVVGLDNIRKLEMAKKIDLSP